MSPDKPGSQNDGKDRKDPEKKKASDADVGTDENDSAEPEDLDEGPTDASDANDRPSV